ncbi:uncharacterized protein LOC18448199 isoform X2 [Amborella trichopoda]|uniref:uncharacterized protein LOC18448199 isoform X2 n=1 Tax=Amborella trichopoda TaxID=13333 RepID=UPI0009C10527|nr:uncharacterized protein LOC18448199 isoform X2 [Amborella trichopoda]|eukprot:XP_020531645.1 uncharacterized protein LOC18448199 isoform X2 [Amborella trichopoda]
MSITSEITAVLVKLACHLQNSDKKRSADTSSSPDGVVLTSNEACNQGISLLNKSINTRERPGFLDVALALLCYEARDVCNSTIRILVDTLISALLSSISCKVLLQDPCRSLGGNDSVRQETHSILQTYGIINQVVDSNSEQPFIHNEKFLLVGSLISFDDCPKLVEACLDVLKKLEEHGYASGFLADAVLRVATSVSCYKCCFPLSSTVFEKSTKRGNSSFLNFHYFLTEGTLKENNKESSRLLSWYLEPLSLKHDISIILHEIAQRPFICLKTEFHQRKTWRGSSSILELRSGLVSSVLDILSNPMRWGISLDMGLRLPLFHTLFPHKLQTLLRILSGPISCCNLLHLVDLLQSNVHISKQLVLDADPHAYDDIKRTNKMLVYQNTIWALLLDFPVWFYFSAMALFQREHSLKCQSKCKSNASHENQTCNLCQAAAKFLGWVLSPLRAAHINMVNRFIEVSKSWIKLNEAGIHRSHFLKEKKRKQSLIENDMRNESHTRALRGWLEDFHMLCGDYCNETEFSPPRERIKVGHRLSTGERVPLSCSEPSLLFRKILLGVFVGNACTLEDWDCMLLFHYIVTSRILSSNKKHSRIKLLSKLPDNQESNEWSVRHCIRGVALVFDLGEILEDMSQVMFEDDSESVDFVGKAKAKAETYLCNCIEPLLLQREGDMQNVTMLMDLHCRLVKWTQEGRGAFVGSNKYGNVIRALDSKISFLQGKAQTFEM